MTRPALQSPRRRAASTWLLLPLLAACDRAADSDPEPGDAAAARAPLEGEAPKRRSGLVGRAADPARGPVSQFVRRIFQDRHGALWLGTNGDGVARYDGESLQFFTPEEGFGGYAVRAIREDAEGDVWFATSGGVTRYDGERFENFTEADGLLSNSVWCLEFDAAGMLWIGSVQGLNYLEDGRFESFALPAASPDPTRGVTSARIVHCITKAPDDRLWFGTNGGAYSWDGETLGRVSVEDGLSDENVNDVLVGRDGTIWFATHHGGVCRMRGSEVTRVTPDDGVEGTEVWSFYEDQAGHVWFPVEGYGVYCFDGDSFVNYDAGRGLASRAVQCTHQDRQGRIWCGGHTGLYRLDGSDFVPVHREGPWD